MITRSRRGFSLIELIVVLFIVAILFALLWPSFNRAHIHSRRTVCLSNIKMLGLATANYASAHAGHLPPLLDDKQNWPKALLPYLDQRALVREMQEPSWRDENSPYLKFFVCPNDAVSNNQPAGLSYAINAGYGFFPVDPKSGAVTEQGTHSLAQDWNDDGEITQEDQLITRATGLAWRPDEEVPSLTVEDIGAADGLGSTLLFAENLHAGPWTSRDTRALVVVISRDRLTFAKDKGPLALRSANLGPFAINAAEVDAPNPIPTPSSNHDGTVNVVFADGRASSLDQEIDPLVYARLLTSQGSLFGQAPINEGEY